MEIEGMSQRLKGVIAVQLFPFDRDGKLDLDGLARNTRFLVDFADNGARDVVILTNGSTSEFYAMCDEEQKEAVKTVLSVRGGTPVIVGTSRAGTQETVRFSRWAQEAGADAVMVVNPYYHQATKEGLFLHHQSISDALEIGVMVYNNPFCSGSWIDPDLMARIATLKNVIAVKENTASAPQYADIARATESEDLIMIAGLGERMYPAACAYRCSGFVSDIMNFAPALPYEIYEAGKSGDFSRMYEALRKLDPYYKMEARFLAARADTSIMPDVRRGNPVYQAMGKSGMDYVGLAGREVRLPMIGLTVNEKEELRAVLEKMEIPKVG